MLALGSAEISKKALLFAALLQYRIQYCIQFIFGGGVEKFFGRLTEHGYKKRDEILGMYNNEMERSFKKYTNMKNARS